MDRFASNLLMGRGCIVGFRVTFGQGLLVFGSLRREGGNGFCIVCSILGSRTQHGLRPRYVDRLQAWVSAFTMGASLPRPMQLNAGPYFQEDVNYH